MKNIVLLLFCVGFSRQADHCDVDNVDKYDCAPFEAECIAAGCCWVPVERNSSDTKGIPWCFYPSDMTHPPDPCEGDVYNWVASDPGFTDAEYDIMYENYKVNLNIRGTGAIIAAPDAETPGGDYRYHWMRDAGLSVKAWMDINDNDYDAVREVLEGYAKWTGIVQHKNDPNDIDVRIEPKFTIDDQEPGGWCRPQTDGPALRAMAMAKWGNILIDTGHESDAKTTIWPLIKFDLEWVTENWESTGCDLWEEVRSDDFFFNRMAFIYCLNAAADFADRIGESMGSTYRSVADEIKGVVTKHWNGKYLYESENRPDDGATIHAITTFSIDLYTPDSEETAATIRYLVKAFCNEYPINQEDNDAGDPGILIGRYPNDSYAGGNPWQLLTAILAECFYIGASITRKKMATKGNYLLSTEENAQWMALLQLEVGATASDLAAAQVSAGDAVLTRLHNHIKSDGGKVDEQIDKHTGKQASAENLTWSYANILHALHIRRGLSPDPPGPTTTTTTGGGPTDGPTTDGPGPTDGPTDSPPQTCCSSVKFESTGAIGTGKPELVGSYRKVGSDGGRSVYKKDDVYLHYVNDVAYKFEAWVFSNSVSDMMGEVVNEDDNNCVDATSSTWEMLVGDSWQKDATAQVTCDGNSEECCSGLSVSSSSGVSSSYPELLGTYRQDFSASSDHPVYTKDDKTIFYLKDVMHHFEGWTISDSTTDIGPVTNVGESDCAEKAGNDWEYLDAENGWVTDSTLQFECVEFAECCETVVLSSTGLAQQKFPELMGTYTQTGYENGRPVYVGPSSTQLSYLNDVGHHWEGWVLGEGLGNLSNDGDASCPGDLSGGWDVLQDDSWVTDETVQVVCDFR